MYHLLKLVSSYMYQNILCYIILIPTQSWTAIVQYDGIRNPTPRSRPAPLPVAIPAPYIPSGFPTKTLLALLEK